MKVRFNLINFQGETNKNKIEDLVRRNSRLIRKMDFAWQRQSAENYNDRFQEKVCIVLKAKTK